MQATAFIFIFILVAAWHARTLIRVPHRQKVAPLLHNEMK